MWQSTRLEMKLAPVEARVHGARRRVVAEAYVARRRDGHAAPALERVARHAGLRPQEARLLLSILLERDPRSSPTPTTTTITGLDPERVMGV